MILAVRYLSKNEWSPSGLCSFQEALDCNQTILPASIDVTLASKLYLLWYIPQE